MKTELKDVIHLYLGCDCTMVDGDLQERKFKLNAYNLNYYRQWISDLKPILRPLSSMTTDERKYLLTFANGYNDLSFVNSLERDAEITKYLLSNGFDLFNLIPEGLAIEKVIPPTLMKEKI
jgi:hypothetical protein